MAKNAEKSLQQYSAKHSLLMNRSSSKNAFSRNVFDNTNASKSSLLKEKKSPTPAKQATGVVERRVSRDMSEDLCETGECITTSTYAVEDNSAAGQTTSNTAAESDQQKADKEEKKVLISGDDILIEYCDRKVVALKQISDDSLRPGQQS